MGAGCTNFCPVVYMMQASQASTYGMQAQQQRTRAKQQQQVKTAGAKLSAASANATQPEIIHSPANVSQLSASCDEPGHRALTKQAP